MSDTSATWAIKKEDVERNTPGNPVEIPYVQIQEESTERGLIGIKLPNGTKIKDKRDGDPPYCQQGVVSHALYCCRQELT